MSARRSGRKKQRTSRYSLSPEIVVDNNIGSEVIVSNNVSDLCFVFREKR